MELAIEIVDFPIKNGDFPYLYYYVSFPEGTYRDSGNVMCEDWYGMIAFPKISLGHLTPTLPVAVDLPDIFTASCSERIFSRLEGLYDCNI